MLCGTSRVTEVKNKEREDQAKEDNGETNKGEENKGIDMIKRPRMLPKGKIKWEMNLSPKGEEMGVGNHNIAVFGVR